MPRAYNKLAQDSYENLEHAPELYPHQLLLRRIANDSKQYLKPKDLLELGGSMPNKPSPACRLQLRKTYEEYEYFKDGDVIIGGVFTINYHMVPLISNTIQTQIACFNPVPYYYSNLLTFFFSINGLSKDMPNVSLGYHVFDSCMDENKAIKTILQILSGPGKTVPNYSCTKRDNIIAFIGDQFSKTTLPMAQLLSLYRYTQISYGASSQELSNKKLYPKFFRTVQNLRATFIILCKLIKFLNWTWVGIIAANDDEGEKGVQELTNIMNSEGICSAFIIKVKQSYLERIQEFERSLAIIQKSSAQVLVICGSNSFSMDSTFAYLEQHLSDRTLVLDPAWAVQQFLLEDYPKTFNGSLVLSSLLTKNSLTAEFLKNIQRIKYPNDLLLENIWIMFNHCLTSNPKKNKDYRYFYDFLLHNCSREAPITSVPGFNNYAFSTQVHISVYTMISALKTLLSLRKPTEGNNVSVYAIKNQLHHVLKTLTYKVNASSYQYYNEDNEFITKYYIKNYIVRNNKVTISNVGQYNPLVSSTDDRFSMNESNVFWKNGKGEIPKSQCSETCLPGSRIVTQPGIHRCCYNCLPCSEGTISNTSDSEDCFRCADDEWPSKKKDLCVPRPEDFLSYKGEAITVVVMSVSVLFHVKTILIITVFIWYRDTPIVKANKRSLSFVLLVSIMLGFLCVFLFLGRPIDITCMLRQSVFTILFSIAESSVLAKTIMVCIAFKATKPNSVCRKWIGVKLPIGIVLACSSAQVIICISWLATSPPFQELDLHTYQEKVIVQCNEGSVIGFYSVLVYMGILAAVSFIIAFFARTLPDSFNEAKNITFSMLVFCSVWIATIPAYLSTKGKYMVAVEIFAIFASNIGLLGCIFFSKCYIILYKPKANTKICLAEKKKRKRNLYVNG